MLEEGDVAAVEEPEIVVRRFMSARLYDILFVRFKRRRDLERNWTGSWVAECLVFNSIRFED